MTNDLQKRIDDLAARVAALEGVKEPKADTWPKIGDEYFLVYPLGQIITYKWSGDQTDQLARESGNIHRTREEAELHIRRQKVIVRWNNLAAEAWAKAGKVLDWENKYQPKYYPRYDHCGKRPFDEYAFCYVQDFPHGHFPCIKSIKAAIDLIGHDDMKLMITGAL